MNKKTPKNSFKLNRRNLIAGSFAFGAVSAGKVANSNSVNQENLPPNIPEWTTYLGDGVDVNPYGLPSEYESHVIRRNVEWLTATSESSVNFTPIQDLKGFVKHSFLFLLHKHN